MVVLLDFAILNNPYIQKKVGRIETLHEQVLKLPINNHFEMVMKDRAILFFTFKWVGCSWG